MAYVKIEINEKSSIYVITEGANQIKENLELKSFLLNFLGAEFTSDNEIILPFTKETKEIILNKLNKVLFRYDFEERHSEEMNRVMKSFYREEENFKSFSLQAESIKENRCNKNEFEKFAKSLSENMPNRRLYPLQLLSSYHLAFSQNACNFSVPGSGKTSIVYGTYTYLKNLSEDDPRKIDKILIVGPLSSFGPWENEFLECFGRKPKSKRLFGKLSKDEKSRYLYSHNPAEVTLIGYQGVVNLVDEIKSFLKMHKTMVVLDEAHKIKNIEGGITAQSVLSLSRNSKSRVVLTGTPLPNGFEDLHNLYKFIWPTKNIIRFHPYQLKQMSSNLHDSRIRELINNVSPFFIRIKKSDLGIPAPIEYPPIKVKMGKSQREIYDYIENKYIASMIGGEKSGKFRDMLTKAKLIRLMQAATNPSLLKKPLEQYYREQGISDSILIDDTEIIAKISKYEGAEVPSKFEQLLKLIKPLVEEGKKIVVWTTFVKNITDLQEFLSKNGINTKAIFGEIPVDLDEDCDIETREKIINEFHKSDSSFNVLLANPFSVSESISLHKACHIAIYLERTFNAGHFIQSKDRIHRYGLDKNDKTEYYYITSEDSIDETIHERLKFKEKRMNEAIEKDPIPLFFNVLNEDFADQDIKAIIDDYGRRNI